MIQEFLDVKETDTLPELSARLGNFLGLEKPVPLPAMMRAIEDPMYASNLITCRNAPGFLEPLLNDKQNQQYAVPESAISSPTKKKSDIDLIKKATSAFINWGKAGFSVADEATIERRENACLACPNLKPPETLLQKLTASKKVDGKIGQRLGNSVCDLCGCGLSRKIKLPSEACPDKHPEKVGFTRWDEVIGEE